MPYALCCMPYTLWMTFPLNFFSVSKFRNYLRKIPYAIRPMPYALCPMPYPYRKHFSSFFRYFEITKLFRKKLSSFFFLLFRNLETTKLRKYLGKKSSVFILLFRNFEITKSFGEELPFALYPMPYTIWITFLQNFFSVSKFRNYETI